MIPILQQMKTYLTVFFFFWIGMLEAQDWRHICCSGRTLFTDPSGNMTVTEADSLRGFTAGDTVFYSFHTIGFHAGMSCADTAGGSLMGSRVHKLPTGWFHFFNYKHDTVYLNTVAPLNSSWRFGKINTSAYIQATITALGADSVLGQYDSVKTIKLQAKNNLGQNISHLLNNVELVLSKHFGFTKLINLNIFPENATVFSLSGRSLDSLGLQEVTGADIYDYDIGDEFHYLVKQSQVHYMMETHKIETVMDKQSPSPGHISYNMHVCGLTAQFIWPSYHWDTSRWSTDYVLDINLDSVNQLNLFTATPAEFVPYLVPGGPFADQYYWKRAAMFNYRTIKGYGAQCFKRSSAGCWQYYSPIDVEYGQGLGNTKYLYSYGTGVYKTIDLVYYKKGNELYGTPVALDCLTLHADGEMAESRAVVVPNPFRSSATVTFRPLHPSTGMKIRVTDTTGRKVLEDDFLPPEYTINRGTLRNGVYFLQISGMEGKPPATSKLVIY
jgi:hypothetical protein